MLMKCKKHPKYLGKKIPKAPCKECWKIYFYNHKFDTAIERIVMMHSASIDLKFENIDLKDEMEHYY
jgi:hypothetical protein